MQPANCFNVTCVCSLVYVYSDVQMLLQRDLEVKAQPQATETRKG